MPDAYLHLNAWH